MAQEIKLMVRPGIGGKESVATVEREFARLSELEGWRLNATFYLGTEKGGSHNVMFVLVRDTEKTAQVGRPKKAE
jgi:hypothetical protein